MKILILFLVLTTSCTAYHPVKKQIVWTVTKVKRHDDGSGTVKIKRYTPGVKIVSTRLYECLPDSIKKGTKIFE